MFGALGNPHRLAIFLRLASCCPPRGSCVSDGPLGACVGDLGKKLGIAPSTLSHHIKELRRAGLVRAKRRGQKVECRIEPQVLSRLGAFFDAAADV